MFCSVASFVPARPAIRQALSSWSPLVHAPVSPTSLQAVPPEAAAACYSYLEGIKTPATLIAGSSIVALFSLTNESRDTYTMTKARLLLLRIYHAVSLLSVCLSLSAVFASQAATAQLLLLSPNPSKSLAAVRNAYSLLLAVVPLEFLLARWSFLMSILGFFASTTFRMILEFGLFLDKGRRLAGCMAVSLMAGVATSIVSYANTSSSLPGIVQSTTQLMQLLWKRAYVDRFPLQIVSLVLLAISVLCSLKFMLPGSIDQEQLADIDNYV